MVFVPTTRSRLEAWRAGGEVGGSGFSATPAMVKAHAYGPTETEDAEYAALQYAGVASLVGDGRRWVAAVEVREVTDGGSPYGLVEVATIRWRDLQAVFADEAEALTDVAALAASVAGRPVEELLADPVVLDAAEEYDLLWYTPEELDRIA